MCTPLSFPHVPTFGADDEDWVDSKGHDACLGIRLLMNGRLVRLQGAAFCRAKGHPV